MQANTVLFDVYARESQRVANGNWEVSRTSTDALNGNRLGTLRRGRQGLLGRVEGGVEEGVDESRLAKTGFT